MIDGIITNKHQQGYPSFDCSTHTLTKKQLFESFDGKISKSVIQNIDGDWQIVGKYCCISWLGKSWDVFLCNSACFLAGLDQRKVKNIIRNLESSNINRDFTVLDGEAFSQDVQKEVILKYLSLLGIRRARTLTPKQRATLSKRMKKIRGSA